MIDAPTPRPLRWIHRLAWASLVVAVLLTIGLGGAVTSADVGMAYPTWPDMNGASLFNFFYGKLAAEHGAGANLEHTHRQAGALIGLLCIALAAACWLGRGVPARLRRLSLLALVVVVAQGLLGAFRVLENAQAAGIVHALGAQFLVVLLVAVLRHSTPAWLLAPGPAAAAPGCRRLRAWSRLAILLLFLNLAAAASLRHKEGAFAGHFVLALTSSAVLLGLVWLVAREGGGHPPLRSQARWLANLLGVQLGLGVGTWAVIWGPLVGRMGSEENRFLAQAGLSTAHLLVGVLVMAVAAALHLETVHRLQPPAPGASDRQPDA
ncbi:MAG: hypothetical protein D6702_05350 [Planctomycetota bacterium]|nr:MAG: hypothetical protein D6702_05350 [Planctomycetota bacterium]